MPASSPTYLIPGEVVKLDETELMLLGGFVSEMVDDLEEQYSTFLKTDIPVWWKWKNAVPAVKEKSFPWRGASNLVIPYIRTIADATSATQFGKIFGAAPRIWKVSSEDEDPTSQEFARAWDRHLNWAAAGNDFNLKLTLYDWLDELTTIGSSVVAINYRNDNRHVFFGKAGNNRGKMKSKQVEWQRGPNFEHAPRENFLWDTRYRIGDAPCVVREHEYTQVQLEMMAQGDDAWDKEAIEEVARSTGNEGSTASVAREAKNRMENFTTSSKSVMRPHDIREIHIDLPLARAAGIELPGDQSPDSPWIPLVIHLHRGQRRILRIVAEPYHLPYKPFFDGFYRKTGSRGHSIGVSKLLMPIQDLMSTLFNQAVDSATRMNALWAKTRNAKLAMKPIDFSRPMLVTDMAEIEPFQVSTQFVNNLPLINAANVLGERVSGINDPLLGRETRAGGHPAPATSTLALLQQQDKMNIATDEIMRETISRMGEAATILYQQFETNDDGKFERVHGAQDAEAITEIIFPNEPIPQNYLFDVSSMSPNNNPDTEMKKAVIVNQVTNDYWAFVLRVVQTMEANPNLGPMAKATALQSIEAKTEVYKKFLEASNEDDIHKFIAKLNEPGGANDPAQLAQMAQQALGQQGGPPGGAGPVPAAGPMEGPGTSPEGGTIVAPAGGGVLLQ